ncbi:EAL domain-containing protein [Buttiauxella sp. B2]|uniref:EAL domain-containing protein n=1 Tax=Buttiauxella sp. B2 TaxID=2587812 RepID=UPI001674CCD1|nr:EAL domain-containing protein [Buttiauxella sp. B2]
MRESFIASICGLLFFITGVLALNWQLWHSEIAVRKQEAQLSASLVDDMIDEARKATDAVRTITTGLCTPDAQRLLNREAAMGPHLRYVVLIRNSEVWCSSLLGNKSLRIQGSTSATTNLTLYPGDEISGGSPVLFYQTPGYSGYIGASIGFSHINIALKTASDKILFTLVVGKNMLPYNSVVKPLAHGKLSLHSIHYPFSIDYEPPPFFNWERLITQGNFLMMILAIMSSIIAWFILRYLNQYITPEENLRRAIARGEIVPFYQPIVNSASGKISGFEILARWKQPDSGFISPDIFIPVAEKSGQIIELTHVLMMRVIEDLRTVALYMPEGLHIGINISAAHEHSEEFEYDCLQLLEIFADKKITLVLEITEREPLALTPKGKAMFARLRSHGVLLALDDFGTGYSGISYLNDFCIDYLKIDKSFVRRISPSPDSTLLVDCVIDMAKNLSLSLIAEGVETQYQADYLNTKGIQFLQGYYFWRPVPFTRLAPALLLSSRRVT